jgi:hypothetical protein
VFVNLEKRVNDICDKYKVCNPTEPARDPVSLEAKFAWCYVWIVIAGITVIVILERMK